MERNKIALEVNFGNDKSMLSKFKTILSERRRYGYHGRWAAATTIATTTAIHYTIS